jgi:hypothetical protein
MGITLVSRKWRMGWNISRKYMPTRYLCMETHLHPSSIKREKETNWPCFFDKITYLSSTKPTKK